MKSHRFVVFTIVLLVFLSQMSKNPNRPDEEDLTEIYLTTGNFSIIAIGYFNDNPAITRFITENLKNIKMIDYDVITVLDKVKHELYGI